MEPRRLFIAILPDETTRDALLQSQVLIESNTDKARLTARENLHLTLAFLGNQDETHARAVSEAMRQCVAEMAGEPALHLALGDIGIFDRRKGGCIFWRGVAGGSDRSALEQLRGRLCQRLRETGFDLPETFKPHFTLARSVRVATVPRGEKRDRGEEARKIKELCAKIAAQAPDAAFQTKRLSLMWSHRAQPDNVLQYTEIDSVCW